MTVAAPTCAGQQLTEGQRAFFKDANPFGFILFADNIDTPDQIQLQSHHCGDCRPRRCSLDKSGRWRCTPDIAAMWRSAPPAKVFGDLCARRYESRTTGSRNQREAYRCGVVRSWYRCLLCAGSRSINSGCSGDVIGDRSFGSDPDFVIAIARAFADGLDGRRTPDD